MGEREESFEYAGKLLHYRHATDTAVPEWPRYSETPDPEPLRKMTMLATRVGKRVLSFEYSSGEARESCRRAVLEYIDRDARVLWELQEGRLRIEPKREYHGGYKLVPR